MVQSFAICCRLEICSISFSEFFDERSALDRRLVNAKLNFSSAMKKTENFLHDSLSFFVAMPIITNYHDDETSLRMCGGRDHLLKISSIIVLETTLTDEVERSSRPIRAWRILRVAVRTMDTKDREKEEKTIYHPSMRLIERENGKISSRKRETEVEDNE